MKKVILVGALGIATLPACGMRPDSGTPRTQVVPGTDVVPTEQAVNPELHRPPSPFKEVPPATPVGPRPAEPAGPGPATPIRREIPPAARDEPPALARPTRELPGAVPSESLATPGVLEPPEPGAPLPIAEGDDCDKLKEQADEALKKAQEAEAQRDKNRKEAEDSTKLEAAGVPDNTKDRGAAVTRLEQKAKNLRDSADRLDKDARDLRKQEAKLRRQVADCQAKGRD